MAAPRMRRRLHNYLAEGRGYQIQLPHPKFLERRKKKTQGLARDHGNDRRAAGAGTGTETSAHQCSKHVHSLLLSPPLLPSMDGFPNTGDLWAPLEGSGLMPGSWAHVPLVWLYQAPSKEQALLPVNGTVTNGPPPHSQSCKRWTKLAGNTPVREPSPSMKPTWGCRKRVQGSASLILRYQPQNFFPAQFQQGFRKAKLW